MTSQHKLNPFERELVARGLFDLNSLAVINKSCKDSGQDLITHMQSKQLIDETLLAQIISKLYGFQFKQLDNISLEYLPDELLDEKICLQGQVMPISARDGNFEVALWNPGAASMDAIEKLRFRSGMKFTIVVASASELHALMDKHFSSFTLNSSGNTISSEELISSLGVGKTEIANMMDQPEEEESGPIVKFVNKLMLDAIKIRASDLHFEPFEDEYRIRYRVDGVLKLIERLPVDLANRITSRVKVMSKMDISEKRNPQDGRITMKISDKKRIDFRVNSLPTVHGEKLVLRILDPSSAQMGIDALGYEAEQKALFLDALSKPQGMILITGPTGSGKTVSLYTGLNILNSLDVNISTAEDPVEINLPGVNQVNVTNKTGLTFASALRAFLRQDPDIIMVGEIRDLETAEIAIKAAQTGHMVMSTLHTNSAPETLTRLRNMGVPAFNVATSVNLVIAQRLARRLCPNCKKLADIPHTTLKEIGFSEAQLADPDFRVYEPVGCSGCANGYKGRVGLYEVMKITSSISKLIMEEGNAIEIAEQSAAEGFDNLRMSGIKKIIAGMTSVQEIMRVTSD